MEASKVYDLLPTNDKFRVTFDLFKPRPHFLLFPKPGVGGMSEDHSLEDNQGQQLIETAREMLASWNISSGTLSIHRGSWISKKSPTVHFHLCVDVTNYLNIYRAKKVTDFFSWFGNQRSYNRWKRKFEHRYEKDVEEYPREKYHGDAVDEINRIIANEQSTSESTIGNEQSTSESTIGNEQSTSESTIGNEQSTSESAIGNEQSTSENTENLVYWHRKHPKIAFPGNGTAEDLENILIKMQEYAESNILTNSEDENCGCHLCLNLGSDSGTY